MAVAYAAARALRLSLSMQIQHDVDDPSVIADAIEPLLGGASSTSTDFGELGCSSLSVFKSGDHRIQRRLHTPPIHSIVDDVTHPADVARDDGKPHRHRLDENQSETVGACGHNEDVGFDETLAKFIGVWLAPMHRNPRGRGEFVARDDVEHESFGPELGHRIDEEVSPFAREVTTNEQQSDRAVDGSFPAHERPVVETKPRMHNVNSLIVDPLTTKTVGGPVRPRDERIDV